MARRLLIAAVGASMTGMGVVGLVHPHFYLSFTGFSLGDPTGAAFQLGELRAIYGGLFTVIGVFTLVSAVDPVVSRSRLVVLGWCWLGLVGGRLLGALLDGDPGLRGWGLFAFELAAGVLILMCARHPRFMESRVPSR